VTWASLPVRQTRQSRAAMIGMSGRMKREVLTYVTKNGLEKVLSANMVCGGRRRSVYQQRSHISLKIGGLASPKDQCQFSYILYIHWPGSSMPSTAPRLSAADRCPASVSRHPPARRRLSFRHGPPARRMRRRLECHAPRWRDPSSPETCALWPLFSSWSDRSAVCFGTPYSCATYLPRREKKGGEV